MDLEVVIGFAVGYWVGTRQGREGLQRALDSAREIWESPEARRLAGESLSVARGAAEAAPVSDILERVGGISGIERNRGVIREVLDDFLERRFGRAA